MKKRSQTFNAGNNINSAPILLQGLFYLCLLAVLLIVLLPFVTMLLNAFKPRAESLSANILPSRLSFESFEYVLSARDNLFFRSLLNSIKVCSIVVVIQVVVAGCCGYAFSRFKGIFFRGFSNLMLLLYMIPGGLTLIPLFIIFKNLSITDTHFSLFLAYTSMTMPFSVWMTKGYIDSVSFSLEESAMVEGASQFKAFYKIILPIILPGISSVAIFTFISCWQEYLMSSIFVKDQKLITMTVALQMFVQEFGSDVVSLMAAACLGTIPMIILLIFGQRYIVAGMTAGAVKG
ncbi:carbohydrate ABC transporter permease [Neglectibacter caecimuris]|uniref:carbohydrate ABC transporter permease n=1 Tax=Neglectibacter caecimuris TaxID=3093658 RepID=UPI002AC8A1B8|nr:carbohydrate ABC transporter permease [Neglectibacter sp. M00184]